MKSVQTNNLRELAQAQLQGAPTDHLKNGPKDAEKIASLIGKSIQLSLDLGKSLDIKDTDAHGDALRLALAGLSAPLIGNQYSLSGKMPDDGDLQRLHQSLQAAITFSNNFAPSDENTARLEAIDIEALEGDESQRHVQYLAAMTPVLHSVAAFSFGKPASALIKEISARLAEKAKELREKALNDVTDRDQQSLAEIRLIKVFADIYAQCHIEETGKMMQMSEQERTQQLQNESGGMTNIWDAFDKRMLMLAVLAEAATSDEVVPESDAKPDAAPASDAPAEVYRQEPEEKAAPPASSDSGASPFSSFAKKEPEEAAPESAAEPSSDEPSIPEPPPSATDYIAGKTEEDGNENNDSDSDEDSSSDDDSGASPFSSFAKKE